MSMRLAVAALLVVASGAACAEPVRYVAIVNTAPSSIVNFAVAPAGSDAFETIMLDNGPLHGGGDSATVAIAAGGQDCLRDLRTTFADGRVLLQPRFNVCRIHSNHVGRYLRAMTAEALATP